jgi:ankyrin repeat protein
MGGHLISLACCCLDQVVRLLLERGARLDIKDRSGYTALYWASAKGRAEVVALLLLRGAQVGRWDTFEIAAQLPASWLCNS